MDNNVCGVGQYRDEKNCIGFDFDSLTFEIKRDGEGTESKKALIYYVFSDQIYHNYRTHYQKSVGSESEPLKSQDEIVSEFEEAFGPYVTLGGRSPIWKQSRLIFLKTPGIVRPSSIPHRDPFSYIFMDKVKRRFEIDREELIEENRGHDGP
jgi:hypothetical protein